MSRSHENIRILVTGGAGFVGSTIVLELLAAHPSWTIIVFDVKSKRDYKPPAKVHYIHGDVRNLSDCLEAVSKAKPSLIVHAAGVVPGGLARYGHEGRDDVFDLNVGGTWCMLEATKAHGVKFFIFTGSCTSITDDLDHDYPNFREEVPFPQNSLVYGESKAVAESHVLAANDPPVLSTCSLRPSVILGREDYQLVPSIHACIAKYETYFIIGSGDNLYDFTFVDNVAYSHLLAVENLLGLPPTPPSPWPPPLRPLEQEQIQTERQQEHGFLERPSAAGQAILISNDEPITFRDFMLAIWAQFDHVPNSAWCVTIPDSVAWFAGMLAEVWTWARGGKERTTLCRGSVMDALGTRYASLDRAKRILCYQPRVSLDEGIRISCETLKARLSSGQEK